MRAAASLCVALAGEGGCAVLLPGDRRPVALEPGLAGWPALHARLAVVEAGRSPAGGALAAHRGPVFHVAARRGARPLRGARWLVVPAGVPGRVPAFAVAGCVGHDLGPARRRAA